MTVQELLKAALRVIGVVAPGETPTDAELQDAREALNLMLESWSDERLIIYFTTREIFTLTAGDADYSIGDGADFDTTRPEKIQGAFIRDSDSIDHPVEIIGESKYREISLKSTQARPDQLWYNPTTPNGTIYLYPVPDSAEDLYLDSLKPLTEFTNLTAEIEFPGAYKEALKWNLALRLAPEYGKSASQEVIALANSARRKIKALNAANQVEPVELEVLKAAKRWSIKEG